MSTETQRARNARKRAKLHDHNLASKRVWRIEIEVLAHDCEFWSYHHEVDWAKANSVHQHWYRKTYSGLGKLLMFRDLVRNPWADLPSDFCRCACPMRSHDLRIAEHCFACKEQEYIEACEGDRWVGAHDLYSTDIPRCKLALEDLLEHFKWRTHSDSHWSEILEVYLTALSPGETRRKKWLVEDEVAAAVAVVEVEAFLQGL